MEIEEQLQGLPLTEEQANEAMKGQQGTIQEEEIKQETEGKEEKQEMEEGKAQAEEEIKEYVLDEAFDMFYEEGDSSPHVKLMVFDQCVTFVIDTGASESHISREFAKTLNLETHKTGLGNEFVKGLLQI